MRTSAVKLVSVQKCENSSFTLRRRRASWKASTTFRFFFTVDDSELIAMASLALAEAEAEAVAPLSQYRFPEELFVTFSIKFRSVLAEGFSMLPEEEVCFWVVSLSMYGCESWKGDRGSGVYSPLLAAVGEEDMGFSGSFWYDRFLIRFWTAAARVKRCSG